MQHEHVPEEALENQAGNAIMNFTTKHRQA